MLKANDSTNDPQWIFLPNAHEISLIKITCRGVRDLKKPHYGSHARYPMSWPLAFTENGTKETITKAL